MTTIISTRESVGIKIMMVAIVVMVWCYAGDDDDDNGIGDDVNGEED